MVKRFVIILLVSLALGGGIYAFAMKRDKKGPQFETVKVERGNLVAKVTATGTLSALVTVLVGSQVSGRIASIGADYNSVVKKGQVIAQIDRQLYNATVEQARANLAAAQGNLAKAEAQAEDAQRQATRAVQLAKEKLVSDAERDTALANAKAADANVLVMKGQLAQSKAALSQAEINLQLTTIYSPVSGVVISRSVDVGQTVAASLQAPTLFTIAEDLRKMQVDTSVAEADVGKLEAGMEVTFTVDAYPGTKWKGKVRQIRNAATTVQNVVTYDAVIDVDNPELKLRPGMTANVTFIYAEKENVLKVSNAALRFRPPPELRGKRGSNADGGTTAADGKSGRRAPGDERKAEDRPHDEKTVWLVVGEELRPRKVKVGITDGTMTEVSGDIQEGEALVTEVSGTGSGSGGAQGSRPPRLF